MSNAQQHADALRACTGSTQVTVIEERRNADGTLTEESRAVSAAPGTRVADAVTTRTLDLLRLAQESLAQAVYEGSHTQRQDPAPTHGSPWEHPDLPLAVQGAIRDAQVALAQALVTALAHR